jgi:hypothetical protein
LAVALVAAPAWGSLIEEPFAVGAGLYSEGGNLGSQSAHGTGLTGSWSAGNQTFERWRTVSGGLDHPSVAATDGMARLTRDADGSSGKSASANASVAARDDQVYWVKALMSFSTHNEQRVEIDFGANVLSFGINASGNPGIGSGGSLTLDTGQILAVNTTHLFVAKVDGTGNTSDGDDEDQYLWIDPAPGAEPDTADADVVRNGGDRFGLTDTQPRSINLVALAENGEQRYWDEIEVATSFGDLNLVPEPSSVGMLLIGLLAMALRRRRR